MAAAGYRSHCGAFAGGGAGQAVTGDDVAAQQLVDGHPEASGQLEQGLERKPALTALGLGDRARRDAGEPSEVRLAQLPLRPRRAQAGADASNDRRRRQLRKAVDDAVAKDAAFDARRATVGLADAQARLADDEHALGELFNRPPQRRVHLADGTAQ